MKSPTELVDDIIDAKELRIGRSEYYIHAYISAFESERDYLQKNHTHSVWSYSRIEELTLCIKRLKKVLEK